MAPSTESGAGPCRPARSGPFTTRESASSTAQTEVSLRTPADQLDSAPPDPELPSHERRDLRVREARHPPGACRELDIPHASPPRVEGFATIRTQVDLTVLESRRLAV